METLNIPKDQVINFSKFLYGRTRATEANPAPAIPGWVGGNVANIRAAHRAVDLDIEGLGVDGLEASLQYLVMYCKQFLKQPILTRVLLSNLDTWLTHADRRVKSDFISTAYPNTDGVDGGADIFMAFCEFISDVQTGGALMITRLLDGTYWVTCYDEMRAELSEVRTLVPKVQFSKAEPSELVGKAEKLIASQEKFWSAYKAWLDVSLDIDKFRQVRTIFPELQLYTDRTFVQQTDAIRTNEWARIWCTNTAAHLNAENIPGLSAVWRDVQATLTQVSQCCNNAVDKGTSTVLAINSDYDVLTKDLTLSRHHMGWGQREAAICECREMLKRINRARESGYQVDMSCRQMMLSWQSELLQDKSEADKLSREIEAVAKAHATEIAKAAPKVVLMKLTGFPTFLGWNHQCSTILAGMHTEQAKCSLIYQSLGQEEDRKHLKGVTAIKEILSYLKSKYNRPTQLVGSVLRIGYDMKFPKDDRKVSKVNCLEMLGIRRDLRKYNMQAKIDHFYMSSVAPKVFTEDEFTRFIRERDREENRHIEATKKAEKKAEKSRVLHSTHVNGDEESVDRELADIAKARNIESDDESDTETEILSIVEHPKEADSDPSNKRARRFFFNFIEEVLSSIRSWESSVSQSVSDSKSSHGGKGGKGLPTTLNFNTASEGMSCIITACGKSHKNKHGKPSKSLGFCDYFSKLKLFDKNKIIKTAVVCTKCLCSGHKQKDCKTSLTCGTCGSGTHHQLVCRNNSKSDKGEGWKPKQKPKDTSSFNTETSEDAALPVESGDGTTDELPETTNHCLSVFSLTEVETYLIDQGEQMQRQHTCVGSVHVKCKGNTIPQLAIFDNCSTDHWCLNSLAKALGAKELPLWEGWVRTMTGRVKKKLPQYEFSIKQTDGNFAKLRAFGTDYVGSKPSIEKVRYDRLLKAFGLNESQIENPAGEVGLMIGLKSQRLMLSKIKNLYSPEFPEVGVYESSALKKFIFVGASEEQMSTSAITSCNMTSTLESNLKNFLDAEQNLTLNDNVCGFCYDNRGCASCKHMANPRTYEQMQEDLILRESLKSIPVDGKSGMFKLTCEYPVKAGVNLTYLYDVSRTNRRMAVASSLSLRRKLEREGKLLSFHEKLTEGISKQQYRLIDPLVEQEFLGLPQSFQLVNYVCKDTSATTKIRVVSNSSVARNGGSYNDLCIQGSCLLNNSLDVLNGFSIWGHSFLTDISEAYRSVSTGPITNSCRRFCWFSNPLDPESIQDYHLTCANYGDRPAGNLLAQGLDTVASDPQTPPVVADFIAKSFYVDDGGRSAQTIEKLEEIIDKLVPSMGRYGFQMKHILRSYRQNIDSGSTSTGSVEAVLGLMWDFYRDTLVPNFRVYLCKKRRGEHLDQPLNHEVLQRTTFTMRVVLRAVGCLYDLSGRFLSPVQMKGRSLYSLTAKLTSKWDQDLSEVDLSLCVKLEEFLKELIDIQDHLKPMERAWVPIDHDLRMVICSEDGSIEGYSCTLHARSQSTVDKTFVSRIGVARCKTSNLDVGDNELQSKLLSGKMAEQSLKAIPDLPEDVPFIFLGDSQCTAHTLNPNHLQTDRRRRNLLVKLHRVFRRIHCTYKKNEILFVWCPGKLNPADLNSKTHPELLKVVNGDFWRHGPPEFSSEIFPTSDMKVYGRYTAGSFFFDGLAETDVHLTTCSNSMCMQTESGAMVADKLTLHAQRLSPAGLADKLDDAKQLLADQIETGTTGQLHGALNCDALNTREPVQHQAGLETTGQPLQSVQLLVAKGEYGQVSRKILEKFACISTYTKAARNLLMCIKKDAHQGLMMLRIWWSVLRQSQELFPIKGCKQMLLTKVRGVLGTRNRMSLTQLVTYHKLPASILPTVSSEDSLLVGMLFLEGHVANGTHLDKSLTMLRMRSGFYGVHIPAMGKIVKKFIEGCVSCKSRVGKLEQTDIGNKFGLQVTRSEFGIFAAIAIDILGPYKYQTGNTTRSNQPRKAWILIAVCHQTSAINFEYMQDYSTSSLVEALRSHSYNCREPRVISSDAGSQIKAAARMATRASMKIAESLDQDGQVLLKRNDGTKLQNWAAMLDTIKEKFSGNVTWIIAPSSAQSFNGLAEGNVRITKKLLCNHLHVLTLESFVFTSFLNMQQSFTATKHLLNTRPVYFSETEVVTCVDLTYPGFQSNQGDAGSLKEIVDYTDTAFKHFCNLHQEAIISGRYLKYGSKVVSKPSSLAIGDFVMIIGGTGRPKYGLVMNFVSKHRVTVRMLLRRDKKGGGVIGTQVCNLGNLVHLYTPSTCLVD